jgi:hypothetical protein
LTRGWGIELEARQPAPVHQCLDRLMVVAAVAQHNEIADDALDATAPPRHREWLNVRIMNPDCGQDLPLEQEKVNHA